MPAKKEASKTTKKTTATTKKAAVKKVAKKTTKKDDILKSSNLVMDENAVLVTAKGLEELKAELVHLETVKRKEVAERLKEAISYGDLSENSEYQEAKEEQAFTEGRIVELGKKIKNAKIISETKEGAVSLGSKVVLDNITREEQEEFVLVGSTEVDPFAGRISNESPLGRALLGRKKGDVFKVNAPAGEFEYKLIKLS